MEPYRIPVLRNGIEEGSLINHRLYPRGIPAVSICLSQNVQKRDREYWALESAAQYSVLKGQTVERLYCKKANSMSGVFQNIDPPPPHRPVGVYPPAFGEGGDILAGWRVGWGVNILEDARHSSVLYICKYFVGQTHSFRTDI
jgi:hypothetical protein